MATITGTNGNEIKIGTTTADTITGLGGDDTLYGRAGNDSMYGDAGTDKLYGEAGNDILKGGLGKSYLYGGADNDTLYYDPLSAGQGISYGDESIKGTVIDGGTGYDTAHLYAKALAGGFPALLDIWVQDNGTANLAYEKPGGMADQFVQAGTVVNTEHLVLNGAGGSRVQTGLYGEGPMKVTGTEAKDMFFGGFGNETFIGRGGNDSFYGGGGNDTFVSTATDSDRFVFDLDAAGKTTITGFNGAGVAGGDTIVVDSYLLTNPKTQISEYAGKTTFTLTDDMSIIVDAVGLKQGVDWLFA